MLRVPLDGAVSTSPALSVAREAIVTVPRGRGGRIVSVQALDPVARRSNLVPHAASLVDFPRALNATQRPFEFSAAQRRVEIRRVMEIETLATFLVEAAAFAIPRMTRG